MKNVILILMFIGMVSCGNDDDVTIVEESKFLSLNLTKDFLLDEKWFVHTVVSDKEIDLNQNNVAITDLKTQFPPCDLDSFYVFEQFQPDLVVLNDNINTCDNFQDRYGQFVYPFRIDEKNKYLSINTPPLQLLGGIKDIYLLGDLEFLISRDSSFKLIKAKFQTTINGKIINVKYTLIAKANDRP